MSYNYSLDRSILITDDFKNFCWDNDLKLVVNHAIDYLWDEYGIHAERAYADGPGVEIHGGPIVSERLGLQGIADALAPILKYANDSEYIVTDEHGETITLFI